MWWRRTWVCYGFTKPTWNRFVALVLALAVLVTIGPKIDRLDVCGPHQSRSELFQFAQLMFDAPERNFNEIHFFL